MSSKKPFVLWGKHHAHGPQWLKLSEYSPVAAKTRRREGWQLAILAYGVHPNAGR